MFHVKHAPEGVGRTRYISGNYTPVICTHGLDCTGRRNPPTSGNGSLEEEFEAQDCRLPCGGAQVGNGHHHRRRSSVF